MVNGAGLTLGSIARSGASGGGTVGADTFQECWSVSVIHKLSDSTPDHIRCHFETAYQLVLQSRHIPSLNIR